MAKRGSGQWSRWEFSAVAAVVVVTAVVIFLYRGGGQPSSSHTHAAAVTTTTAVKNPGSPGLVAPSTTTTDPPPAPPPAGSSTTTTTKKTAAAVKTSALALTLPTAVKSTTTTTKSTTTTTSKPKSPTTPTITWLTPTPITIGTALSGTQLDATASAGGATVPGKFVYNPPAGTVLNSSQTLSVTFTPTDTADYKTATDSVNIVVNAKLVPTVTWAKPAAITYGTELSATQLDATASVPGTYTYTPAAGNVPKAGTDTLSVKFTPTDTADYNAATGTTTLTVNQAKPTITWAKPAAVAAGTALSGTQLDASASGVGGAALGGTFVYTPGAGTTLGAGTTNTLSVTFTPTDATDYTTATATTTLTVNAKTTPTITWDKPDAITYGTALSGTQLDAKASVGGTFAYNPPSGTVLGAGNQTLSVTFTPTDTAAYNDAPGTTTLTVNPAKPTVTWATPASVVAGTALGAAQLDATASVPGTFVYTPAALFVLATAGTDTLSVTFNPTSPDYSNVTTTVDITVTAPPPPPTTTTTTT